MRVTFLVPEKGETPAYGKVVELGVLPREGETIVWREDPALYPWKVLWVRHQFDGTGQHDDQGSVRGGQLIEIQLKDPYADVPA